jgi:hypothetical protein
MKTYSNKDFQYIRFKQGLNNLKDQAHIYFDKLWKYKYCERNEAYEHLSKWLDIPEPEAHMSKMNKEQCKKVIEWSIMMLNDFRRLDLDFGDEIKHPYYELCRTDKEYRETKWMKNYYNL